MTKRTRKEVEAESETRFQRGLLVSLLILFALLLVRSSWLSEDAYITFRTVDNFIHGHGLRWNVADRVQVYTHPLWMMLLSGFALFTRELYFTTYIVCMSCTLGTVYLYGARVARSAGTVLLGIGALGLSRAFVDYSTGGLENPLTHLLLVTFAWQFLRPPGSRHRFFLVWLLGTLGALNRLDSVLLFAPGMAWVFWREEMPWKRRFLIASLGVSPLMVWEVFSLFYYGFPFPNTAYAKLNTGVPRAALLKQGVAYTLNMFQNDPLALILLAGGVILPAVSGFRRLMPFGMGLCLYLGYILWIGGDYMSGRFFTGPILMAVIILGQLNLPVGSAGTVLGGLLVFGLGSLAPVPTYAIGRDYATTGTVRRDPNKVIDERASYHAETTLLGVRRGYAGARIDYVLPRAAAHYAPIVINRSAIGQMGYFSGPGVHLLDVNALADPLLARLPARDNPDWWIGHFERVPPIGYHETLESGENRIDAPDIALYWEKIRLITRGPLFDGERLRTVVALNLGKYDHLIDEERFRHPPGEFLEHARYEESVRWRLDYEEISGPEPEGSPSWTVENPWFFFTGDAVRVRLGETRSDKVLEIGAEAAHAYRVDFYRGGDLVGSASIDTTEKPAGTLAVRRVSVPAQAKSQGYDRIEVFYMAGSGKSSLGHVRLLGE